MIFPDDKLLFINLQSLSHYVLFSSQRKMLYVCFIHSNTSLALQLLQSWLLSSEVPRSTGAKLNSVLIIFLEIAQNYFSVALKGLKVVAPL